jgi:hypothetical protein
MLVVCGVQPAAGAAAGAAAAEAEDDRIEEKTNKSKIAKKTVKMLMIARLSNKLQLSVQCDSIKT